MSSIPRVAKTQLFNFQFLITNIQDFQRNAKLKMQMPVSFWILPTDTEWNTGKVKREVATAGTEEELSVEEKSNTCRRQV